MSRMPSVSFNNYCFDKSSIIFCSGLVNKVTNKKCLLMLWKMFAALKPTYPIMSVTQLHMACQLVKPCTRNQKEIIFLWHMPCSLVGSIYVLEKNCYWTMWHHILKTVTLISTVIRTSNHATKFPIMSYCYIWQDKVVVRTTFILV